MACLDPRGPARTAFDLSLLDHDGLMTPILNAQFGPIVVQVVGTDDGQAQPTRRISRLHQRATGFVILDAEMLLNAAALPASVLAGLIQTAKPFGQLLLDAGIAARSVDRELTEQTGHDGQETRLGRRHRLINVQTGAELCQIAETLSPLSVLLAAQQAFAAKGVDHA